MMRIPHSADFNVLLVSPAPLMRNPRGSRLFCAESSVLRIFRTGSLRLTCEESAIFRIFPCFIMRGPHNAESYLLLMTPHLCMRNPFYKDSTLFRTVELFQMWIPHDDFSAGSALILLSYFTTFHGIFKFRLNFQAYAPGNTPHN